MQLTFTGNDLQVLLVIVAVVGLVILLAASGLISSSRSGYSCGCSVGSKLSSSAA